MSVPFFAKALFDYEAVESSELAVLAGDFLTVEEVNESGWCLARKGDANGWLPTDYVQRIENDVPQTDPIAVSRPHATREIVATEGSSLTLPPGMAATPAAAAAAAAATGSSSVDENEAAGKGAFSGGQDAAAAVEQLAAAMAASNVSAAPAAPAASTSAPAAGVAPPKAPTTDASGAPLKVCGFCHEGIRSAFVMAKGQCFHPNHFQCTTCHAELGGRAYLEKDGAFYCEDDYYAQFNPKCGSCAEVIKGPYVSALDQAWHPDHFVCAADGCGQPFEGNQFRKHDNRPYCEKHFEELFAPKCSACGTGIKGQVFEALDNKYHLDCFKCAADDQPIGEGVMFHVHENKIYCPTHFESLFLQKCKGCADVIRGQYIKVMDQIFHPGCWACSVCKTDLKADNCAVHEGDFLCRPCLSARRNADKPAQVQQQMGANPQAVPAAALAATSTTTAPKAPTATATAPAAATSTPSSQQSADEKGAAALALIRARQDAEKAAQANPAPAATSTSTSGSQYADPISTKYPYSVLKDLSQKPADVDPTKREQYLSDDEFKQLIKMDREAFNKLADWKKKNVKQPLGLF